MKKVIILFIAMLSFKTWAGNTPLIKCSTRNESWKSEIILDSIGFAQINFTNLKDNSKFTCDLKLTYLSDNREGVSPSIDSYYTRKACSPTLGAYEPEILPRFILLLKIQDPKKPKGILQWLTKHQPDECKVVKLNLFEIGLNAQKFKKGLWGRKTASDRLKKSK